jgi:formate hydrogenlyase subunit 6/NADH:ubiquinone oxidoreductase subunit I
MKVCPTNAIHPAWFEAGPVGLWTPVLNYDVGYCEYDCSLCTQVCPTDAIALLTVPEKQETKIGMAMFDRSRCLPWAYARSCIVCEEHCPLPEKAIYFEEVEVLDENHEPVLLKQPKVNADLCIGCGACQHSCVYQDKPAIRVHSAGETRHFENQVFL